MRSLGLALLVLVLLSGTAEGRKQEAPVRVRWNSVPEHVRAGGMWDARLSVLRGPGGFDPGARRPVIVVTEWPGGPERRVSMRVDVPPNTFRATVRFLRAGRFRVAAVGFDPRHPARRADIGVAVRIEPALPPVAGVGGASWPWIAVVGAIGALVAVWSIQRVRVRATG